MGDYVTQAEMTTRLGTPVLVGLTNADASATTINTAAFDQAISAAEAEVNGYIGMAYALPLTGNLPVIVKMVSMTLAIYYTHELQPGTAEEAIVDRYDRAIKLLEKIAKGDVDLGLDTGGADDDTADSGRTTVISGGNAHRLTRTLTQGF